MIGVLRLALIVASFVVIYPANANTYPSCSSIGVSSATSCPSNSSVPTGTICTLGNDPHRFWAKFEWQHGSSPIDDAPSVPAEWEWAGNCGGGGAGYSIGIAYSAPYEEPECSSEQFNAAVTDLQSGAPSGAQNLGAGFQFTYSDTYQIDPDGVTVQTGARTSYTCRNSCRQQTVVDVVASSVTLTSYTLTDITTATMMQQSCDDMPADSDDRTDQFIAGGGTPDKPEKDTDNDGVPDSKDNDIDGDGIENNADADQDGDGVNDKADKDGDGITDSHDGDIDGDGIANGADSDADGDGIANGDDPTPHGGGSGPDKGDEEGDKGSGTATNCDQPPTSEGDPQLAAIHKQLWINECEGSDEEFPETDEYYEKATDSAGAELSYDGIMTKFRDRMQQSAVVSGLSGFFNVSFTGSCPVYSANVWVFDITFDQWCSPQVPWGLIQGIVIATALFASARIAFT